MNILGNLTLKQVIVYIAAFSVAYLISGIITPAVSDISIAEAIQNISSFAKASR